MDYFYFWPRSSSAADTTPIKSSKTKRLLQHKDHHLTSSTPLHPNPQPPLDTTQHPTQPCHPPLHPPRPSPRPPPHPPTPPSTPPPPPAPAPASLPGPRTSPTTLRPPPRHRPPPRATPTPSPKPSPPAAAPAAETTTAARPPRHTTTHTAAVVVKTATTPRVRRRRTRRAARALSRRGRGIITISIIIMAISRGWVLGITMLGRGVMAVGRVDMDMDMDMGARFTIRDSKRAARGRGRRGLLLFRGRGISEHFVWDTLLFQGQAFLGLGLELVCTSAFGHLDRDITGRGYGSIHQHHHIGARTVWGEGHGIMLGLVCLDLKTK